MDVESYLSVFAGLPVNLFGLFSSVLSTFQVFQSITHSEILLVLNIADETFLELGKELVVIKYLGISCLSYIFLFSEQNPEGSSFLLAFRFYPLPVRYYLLSLSDWSLHQQRRVMGCRNIDQTGLV